MELQFIHALRQHAIPEYVCVDVFKKCTDDAANKTKLQATWRTLSKKCFEAIESDTIKSVNNDSLFKLPIGLDPLHCSAWYQQQVEMFCCIKCGNYESTACIDYVAFGHGFKDSGTCRSCFLKDKDTLTCTSCHWTEYCSEFNECSLCGQNFCCDSCAENELRPYRDENMVCAECRYEAKYG